MWNVKCDCCGKEAKGEKGEADLPRNWQLIDWKADGAACDFMHNDPTAGRFMVCDSCAQYWPRSVRKIALQQSSALNNLYTAYQEIHGFGNHGREAALLINRAIKYLQGTIQ